MGITIINIALYLFQALMFYYYCNSIFNSRFKRSTRLLFILLGFTILFSINLLRKAFLNTIMSALIIFVIVFFVYSESVFSSLFQAIIYIAILAASEFVALPLCNIVYHLYDADVRDDFHGYLFGTIISKTIHFVCMILLIWFFNRNKRKTITNKGIILTITVTLSNIAVLIMVEYISRKIGFNRETNIIWGVIAGLLLLLTFLLLFNRSYLIHQADKISELTLEKQKRELDEQYFSVIEKKNEDMQVLAHDFKNHLVTIRNLDLPKEANEYIDSIYPEIEKINQIGISKNKTLDLIISKYVSLCEIKAINFSIDVKTANLSNIESRDLTALLTNLLDNAVEAAAQSKEKKISLVIEKQNEFLEKLMVANSCESAPLEKGGKLLSRKADKETHGFGTKSIRKVAEKYGCIYDW